MKDADGNFTIREVFYNEEKSIEGWTDEVSPFGETLEEITNDLGYMLSALEKEVLVEAEVLIDKIEEIKEEIVQEIIDNPEEESDNNAN
jgi:hypothetical protein